MMKPCIDCGTPADGTRCPRHAAAHEHAKNTRQTWQRRQQPRRAYSGAAYKEASATIRQTATRCWICGEGPRPHDPWQADHITPVKDGGGIGGLAPAHRSCNIARANKLRAGKPDPAAKRNPNTKQTGGATPPQQPKTNP